MKVISIFLKNSRKQQINMLRHENDILRDEHNDLIYFTKNFNYLLADTLQGFGYEVSSDSPLRNERVEKIEKLFIAMKIWSNAETDFKGGKVDEAIQFLAWKDECFEYDTKQQFEKLCEEEKYYTFGFLLLCEFSRQDNRAEKTDLSTRLLKGLSSVEFSRNSK